MTANEVKDAQEHCPYFEYEERDWHKSITYLAPLVVGLSHCNKPDTVDCDNSNCPAYKD